MKMFYTKHSKKILPLLFLILLSASLQAQPTLTGIWKNDEEQIKLELRADQSGVYEVGEKIFEFEESFVMNTKGTDHQLEFKIKIKVGTEIKSMFAILRPINSGQIRFIAFFSKELRDNATEEIIESGVILTRE
jgi:hypothetical protein